MENGEDLRDKGMASAVGHADSVVPGWGDKALTMLKGYAVLLGAGASFRAEEFRQYAEGKGLSDPPSLRAYGAVVVKASKFGLIYKGGYAQVSNPRAHRANCSVWIVK